MIPHRLTPSQEEGLQDLIQHWPTWSDAMRAAVVRAILWNNTIWGLKLGVVIGFLLGAGSTWALL